MPRKNIGIYAVFSMLQEVVFAHAQGTAPWNMLVLIKHGLGWGGVGCERSCYADDVTLLMGVGWGWDVNVHVTLMMVRCSWGLGWGGM